MDPKQISLDEVYISNEPPEFLYSMKEVYGGRMSQHIRFAYAEQSTIAFLDSVRFDSKWSEKFNIDETYTVEDFIDFDYKYNNLGFRDIFDRDYFLDNRCNDIWCFGCSFTEGIGVPIERSWTGLLQYELTDYFVKNMGVGGSGPMTTLRLLLAWLKHATHKPKKVFIHGWFPGRVEMPNPEEPMRYRNLVASDFDEYVKTYPEMKRDLENKILDIERIYTLTTEKIKHLLEINDIDYVHIPMDLESNWKTTSLGRDFWDIQQLHDLYLDGSAPVSCHPGILYHKNLAKKFLSKT